MTIDALTSDPQPLAPAPALPPVANENRIVLWQRFMLFTAGVILVALLITAACLPPNPSGMGTHQGLGLPPCSFILWFGQRCPACGMTTSWAYLLRGQVLLSAQTNTGGMLLAMFSIALAPWMVTSAVRGRWWIGPLDSQWILAGGVLVFMVTSAQWIWRVLL
jgi:hypothetical protein